MSVFLISLLAAFFVGLAGSAHCALMCGGISAAMTGSKVEKNRTSQVLAVQLGRVSSYVLAGIIAAILSTSALALLSTDFARSLVQVVLGLAWITIALQLLGYWQRVKFLPHIGTWFWKRLLPLRQYVWPIDSMPRAFAAGALWGWLPCGMSYSMVLVAAASASVVQAALMMAAFGLGTVPTLLIPALAAAKLQRIHLIPKVKTIIALAMIAFGAFTAVSPWLPNSIHEHHQHRHHQQHV